MKEVFVCLLYWFQNCSVLSVGIGGDEDDAEELEDEENVETEDDLVLKEWFDNLYFPFSTEGEQPVPGENDFVLVLVGLMSAGVEQLPNATAEDVDDTDTDDDLDLNLC